MNGRYWYLGMLGFAMLLIIPGAFQRGVRNVAFLSIQRQAMGTEWTAWGLGLRSVSPKSASSFNPVGQWRADTRLGVRSFSGETLIAGFDDCDSRRLTAQRQMDKSNWEMARRLLESVVADCPAYAFAHLELGLVYDRLEQPDLAVVAFEAGGVSNLVRGLTIANYWTLMSRECFSHTLPSDPGRCLHWLSRTLELEGFQEWVALSPEKRREPMLSMARYLWFQHDYVRALRIYQALELYVPDDAWVNYYAGLAASALDQWSVADIYLNRAVQLSPQTVSFWVSHARVLAHLGDSRTAMVMYSQALALESCVPEALDYLVAHSSLIPVGQSPTAEQRVNCWKQLSIRYEARTMPTLVGEVKADELASSKLAMVGRAGILIYGPYQSLPAGRYQVMFRMKTSQPVRYGCLQLDVSTETNQTDGLWLSPHVIKIVHPSEMPDGQYTNLTLTFDSLGGWGFEYRVFEYCGEEVWIDSIEVKPLR